VDSAAQAPIELTEAIDISEEVPHEDQSTEIPEGEAESSVVADASSPSPWAAPLQKRSILRSSPRLSEFEPSVAPAETLPVLDAAAEPGADSPVDLSLPDLSFLDADVLLLRWWKRHHSLKSRCVRRTASVG
jgi:chemosensory pili system protein ChpA (sensor histidine kinase/response regulator)